MDKCFKNLICMQINSQKSLLSNNAYRSVFISICLLYIRHTQKKTIECNSKSENVYIYMVKKKKLLTFNIKIWQVYIFVHHVSPGKE